jgi:hypothetical protein
MDEDDYDNNEGVDDDFGGGDRSAGVRGNYMGVNEDGEYGDDGIEENIAVTVDDVAPAMPTDFYENFEHFLSRAAPSLKVEKVKNKSKRELEQEIAHEFSKKASSLPVLPHIQKKTGTKSQDLPPRPIVPVVTSKVAEAMHGKSKKSNNNKDLDIDLLQQAFQYVAQLSDSAHDESSNDTGDIRRHPSSAPERVTPEKAKPRGKNSGLSAASGKKNGVVKKLRLKTQQNDFEDGSFNISAAAVEEESKKALFDVDALVANFEQGITMHKLQAELNSSKESMARSEAFMRQLAREFGGMASNSGGAHGPKPVAKTATSKTGYSSKR